MHTGTIQWFTDKQKNFANKFAESTSLKPVNAPSLGGLIKRSSELNSLKF